MADISTELQAILDAVYGEDVRDSIHDAIDIVNKVGEKNITVGSAVTSQSSSIVGYYDESVYINKNTWDVWVCDGTKWVLQGNIKGGPGGVTWEANGVLGAKNVFDYSVGKTTTTTTYTPTNNGKNINISSIIDGTYRSIVLNFKVKKNIDYCLATNVTITSGHAGIKIQQTDSTVIKTESIASSGAKTFTFNSGNNEVLQMVLFCTWSTSEAGNVDYDDLIIQLASDTDSTYQPYAMTNKELTDSKFLRSEQAVLGAKNLYDCIATTKTDSYGVTWTVDAKDQNIIVVSGTPTGFESFNTHSDYVLLAGDYILNGILENTTNVGLNAIILRLGTTNVETLTVTFSNNNYYFTIPDNVTYDNIVISLKRTSNNVACSGTIKLMVRLASDTDNTYAPYAMTNQDLTDKITSLFAIQDVKVYTLTQLEGASFTLPNDGGFYAFLVTGAADSRNGLYFLRNNTSNNVPYAIKSQTDVTISVTQNTGEVSVTSTANALLVVVGFK